MHANKGMEPPRNDGLAWTLGHRGHVRLRIQSPNPHPLLAADLSQSTVGRREAGGVESQAAAEAQLRPREGAREALHPNLAAQAGRRYAAPITTAAIRCLPKALCLQPICCALRQTDTVAIERSIRALSSIFSTELYERAVLSITMGFILSRMINPKQQQLSKHCLEPQFE